MSLPTSENGGGGSDLCQTSMNGLREKMTEEGTIS